MTYKTLDRVAPPLVAVVGAGYWGINHVRNFHEIGALGMVCDNSGPQIARIRESFPQARIESSLDAALNATEIRGIVIATPAETHYQLARAALDAGKDVLVE